MYPKKMSAAPCKCLSERENPSLDFKSSFFLGFLWISRNAGRQNKKGLFLLGFVVEVIADNQKSAFRSIPENKDSFINEGLWARSRHPNYFGEITLWTGITVMGISTFDGMNYLALFSPIFSYLLLNYVSGVRMLEYRGHKKWGHLDAYKKYKEETPKLIPRMF